MHLARQSALTLFVVAMLVAISQTLPAVAAGTDRVRTLRSSEAGELTDVTPTEITIDKGTSGTRKIPVNEIVAITLHDEPTELTQARVNVKNGGYVNASELLQKIDMSKVDRDIVKQDIDFYQALAPRS